jgi:hypothetical protein
VYEADSSKKAVLRQPERQVSESATDQSIFSEKGLRCFLSGAAPVQECRLYTERCMKWLKSLKNLYRQFFPVEEQEKAAQADDAKQLDFGYVIIAILLYLLLFLVLQIELLPHSF